MIAGLKLARDFSDCVISIDADLQDDVDVIEQFLDKVMKSYMESGIKGILTLLLKEILLCTD